MLVEVTTTRLFILYHLVDTLAPKVISCILFNLRSWRDFAWECFCFGMVAKPWTRVAKPWEDWWRVAKSLTGHRPRGNMETPPPLARVIAREGIWRLRRRSPAHECRQLRRLYIVPQTVSLRQSWWPHFTHIFLNFWLIMTEKYLCIRRYSSELS